LLVQEGEFPMHEQPTTIQRSAARRIGLPAQPGPPAPLAQSGPLAPSSPAAPPALAALPDPAGAGPAAAFPGPDGKI
jgi:hypothetical protein